MNQIPKIIHYVWFGNKPKPSQVRTSIKSWRKYAPDFEIIEWNETNFDLSDNIFASEALDNKNYAFVSDFVRVSVLNQYGGVYLDTDMILLEPLEKIISSTGAELIFGRYTQAQLFGTSFIAAVPHQSFIKMSRDNYYTKTHFSSDVTNVFEMSGMFLSQYQVLDDVVLNANIKIYSEFEIYHPDEKSLMIHSAMASWRKFNVRDLLVRSVRSQLTTKKRIMIYLKLKRFINR